MGVKVIHNPTAIAKKIADGIKPGIEKATEQFVKDSNEYVRVDTGATRDSAYTSSKYQDGKAIWETDYVREIYYTGVPNTERNPNASLMWAHKAARENVNKYRDIIDKNKK